jgi:hypothetical protein
MYRLDMKPDLCDNAVAIFTKRATQRSVVQCAAVAAGQAVDQYQDAYRSLF